MKLVILLIFAFALNGQTKAPVKPAPAKPTCIEPACTPFTPAQATAQAAWAKAVTDYNKAMAVPAPIIGACVAGKLTITHHMSDGVARGVRHVSEIVPCLATPTKK